jgi:hypothetical protein
MYCLCPEPTLYLFRTHSLTHSLTRSVYTGDNDDGEDLEQTVAIAVSVSVVCVFLVVMGYCYLTRKNSPTTARLTKEKYKHVSATNMRSSLLTKSEQDIAKNDELLVESRSRQNSSESVEL